MESLYFPRTENDSLSFRGKQLLSGRHKIHPYPAMLHPLLVDYLLEKYINKPRSTILDPFCGSGVTLLQGVLREHDVIGFDINPIAMLISKVKTSTYDKVTLYDELEDIKDTVSNSKDVDIPSIRNIDTWYHPKVVLDLGRIRHVLKSKNYRYKSFFLACLAYVCRHQSYTRNGEFKRYRMPEPKRISSKNEVIPRFLNHSEMMCDVFTQNKLPSTSIHLHRADVDANLKFDLEVDMILTSPPYGDSGTTVAYEQYTSFGFEWTNDLTPEFEAERNYYKKSLGNKKNSGNGVSDVEVLSETIKRIEELDSKRASVVTDFFDGYYRALRNVCKYLKPNGIVCFIVGNRLVKNQTIPLDQITASFLTRQGMTFESIFVRNICNKVMPSRNSPSNLKGVQSSTMTSEYIVVCRNTT